VQCGCGHRFNHLLPGLARERRKLSRLEPSLSGMVFLWGVQQRHPQLVHHNIFFSTDYRGEFEQIFRQQRPPEDPTIYVAITSRFDAGDAPPARRTGLCWVNMPYLCPDVAEPNVDSVRRSVLEKLQRNGLDLAAGSAADGHHPARSFAALRRQSRQHLWPLEQFALHGIPPAGQPQPRRARALFRRRRLPSGRRHPLVLLSGKMAADLISERE
jgi:hypothetical protein